MSAPPQTQPESRRARRAAERRAAAAAAQARTVPAWRRSPLLAITALIGGIGVIALVGVILLQGSGPKVDSTGLVAPKVTIPAELASGRSLGKADAPVTLQVWSDFQCPICGEFARNVEPTLITTYVTPGVLRIVQMDAAFQGQKSSASFDESVEAGAAARCAADQGRYWPYYTWLFANQNGENQGAFSDARLRAMATSAGLDVKAWDACRATGTQQAAVKAETQQALASGVNATPTMLLNDQKIVGLKSFPDLSGMIEAAAAKAGAPVSSGSAAPSASPS